ncbi:DEAD/DEAH box helicase [Gordonia paraffinivorans]|uniref:DEAD/DEAH box helicase n=1 Tax=Gordonia paraffinivorans TaxID=175628 RepID=UPI003FCE97E2
MQTLAVSIRDEITRIGPLTSVDLAERLSTDVTEVQSALLAYDTVFAQPASGAEEWSLISAEQLADRLSISRPLRPWQLQAFQDWLTRGRVGVVEAVTGAGKTDVGIAAIADARRRGVPTLVLVPDRELIDHWRRILETSFPGVSIGLPDYTKALAIPEQLVVSTPGGLGKRRLTAFRGAGLLLVDELQRIAAGDYTEMVFPRTELTERLGLTAAYEWPSPQTERIVRPYLGEVISGCDYPRAVAEGILARPLVLTVGVSFTPKERAAHEACRGRLVDAEERLTDTGVDLSEGMYETARQIESGSLVGEVSFLAREYLEARSALRRVLDDCVAKVQAVGTIAKGLDAAGRTIVFTASDTVSSAVSDAVLPTGITASPIVTNQDPTWVLGRFGSGALSMLATSRLLDEGVAVPPAQVGIAISSARHRSQMLQRMGRIIHPVEWAGRTAFVLVYVNGTAEDPIVGGAEGHADALLPIAAECHDVSPDEAVRLLVDWLTDENSSEKADGVSDADDVVAITTEQWDPTNAIFDIFAEYEQILTWDELKEVLPDLEVEQAIMRGLDGITWMRIGTQLVGIRGQSVDPDDRIAALGVLAREYDLREGRTSELDELVDVLKSSAAALRPISIGRLGQLWCGVGGTLAESGTVPDGYFSPATPQVEETVSAFADQPISATDADGPTPAPRPVSPAVQAVIAAIEEQGARVEVPTNRPPGILDAIGEDGRRATVRVHSGMGGSWLVSRTDADLGPSDGIDSIVFVDRGVNPPQFYIAPVTPYVKRVRAVMAARTTAHPFEARSGGVNIEKWVVQDGLSRWDLLWPKPRAGGDQTGETNGDTLQLADDNITPADSRGLYQPSRLQFSPEGELRVVLDYRGSKVVGFFDLTTSELRIESAPGVEKIPNKPFRNPAVAAATVKSSLSGRTEFGIGYDDWIVDENTRETLAGYLDDKGVGVSVGA